MNQNHLSKPESHPLKAAIKQQKIPYWQIRKALGGLPSEATISRMLNGIEPLPGELEGHIKAVLEGTRRGL